MKIEIDKQAWMHQDFLWAIYILRIDDYKEAMYKQHGIYGDKATGKFIEKLRKKFDLEALGVDFIKDTDFGYHLMIQLIEDTIKINSLSELTKTILNLDTDSLKKLLIKKLIKDYGEDETVDNTDANHLVQLFSKLNMKSESKWIALQFFENPTLHLEKLCEAFTVIMPFYEKEIIKYEKQMTAFHEVLETSINEQLDDPINEVFQTMMKEQKFEEVIIRSSFVNAESFRGGTLVDGVVYAGVGYQFLKTVELIRGKDEQEMMLRAIGMMTDPMKFKIMTFLKQQTAYGKELCEFTGLSKASLSYHINQMANMGIIGFEQQGNKTYYCLRETYIKGLVEKFNEALE